MSNNQIMPKSQNIPGIYPAVLIDCDEAQGLYGSYIIFTFEVHLGDNRKVAAPYKTSAKFSANSPRGPSAFYELAASLLTHNELYEFDELLDAEMLMYKDCQVLLEKDSKSGELKVTKIFSTLNHK